MNKLLDMHMYVTGAFSRFNTKAVLLQLALDLYYAKVIEYLSLELASGFLFAAIFTWQDKKDMMTGLTSKTKAGRPNWDKVFTQIRSKITRGIC